MIRYAAAVILISIGAYLWYFSTKEKPGSSDKNELVIQEVHAPASTHATITLGDGKQIILDSTVNGAIINQGNVMLKKLDDGQIVYSGITRDVVYNTLTNPRGSSVVTMTLSDGSKVWLNSESSITYPTAFINGKREVIITGEAYFEIAHNSKQPFKVHVAPSPAGRGEGVDLK